MADVEWLERTVTVGRQAHGFRMRLPKGRAGRRQGLAPAILFLHGRGESGRDNARQVEVGLPPAIDANPRDWPFVVVAPQKPSFDRLWPQEARLLEAVLAAVDEEVQTDPLRRYLPGLSQGGNGTWALARHLPWRFAAIAPVCGWADPMRTSYELGDMPVWAFHGDADSVVPAACSEAVAGCLGRFGHPPKLTLSPGVEHNSWDRAYGQDGSGPEGLAAWFLSHRLKDAGVSGR